MNVLMILAQVTEPLPTDTPMPAWGTWLIAAIVGVGAALTMFLTVVAPKIKELKQWWEELSAKTEKATVKAAEASAVANSADASARNANATIANVALNTPPPGATRTGNGR